MKRRLLIAAIFLLAGAVVNVAVAWGCAAFPPSTTSRMAFLPSDTETRTWWHDTRPGGVTDDLAGILIRERFGWRHIQYIGDKGGTRKILRSGATSSTDPRPSITISYYANQTSSGFPMMSLRGEQWSRQRKGSERGFTSKQLRRTGLISVTRWRVFPFLPIWPGFAVNTLFYAVVLWLLIPGPFVLRRVIRFRRGLCPACAYARGEADVCSECGKETSGPCLAAYHGKG